MPYDLGHVNGTVLEWGHVESLGQGLVGRDYG